MHPRDPRDTIPAPCAIGADATFEDFDLPKEWPPVVDEEDGWTIPLDADHLDEA